MTVGNLIVVVQTLPYLGLDFRLRDVGIKYYYFFLFYIQSKSLLTSLLLTESRESAFVHALSSAALAHAVARACSRGELNECSCDSRVRKRTPRHWQWGGCSEVRYYFRNI